MEKYIAKLSNYFTTIVTGDTVNNVQSVGCAAPQQQQQQQLTLAVKCPRPLQTTTLFGENAHVLHRFGRPSTRILKTHFSENVSGWKNLKTQPAVVVWTANPHTSRNDGAIAPPLDL